MPSFLCDGYNGHNNLLDAHDDEAAGVSFQQQTPGNYSRRRADVAVNTQDEAEAAPTPSCKGPLRQEQVFFCLIWTIAGKITTFSRHRF